MGGPPPPPPPPGALGGRGGGVSGGEGGIQKHLDVIEAYREYTAKQDLMRQNLTGRKGLGKLGGVYVCMYVCM
jgi:hypothetical protein